MHVSVQAVFKKFLSATKNKMKSGHPHIRMNGGGAGMSSLEDDEEFEARKHEWQVNGISASIPEHVCKTRQIKLASNSNYSIVAFYCSGLDFDHMTLFQL